MGGKPLKWLQQADMKYGATTKGCLLSGSARLLDGSRLQQNWENLRGSTSAEYKALLRKFSEFCCSHNDQATWLIHLADIHWLLLT